MGTTDDRSKLRVLALCHEDPECLLGGMGRHVGELYRAMARRRDVEIDLVVSGPGEGSRPHDGYTKHLADKLVCWKPRSPDLGALLASDLQMVRTLMRLVAAGKRWDVCHTHEWNTMQVARMARDSLGLPLVGTMHLCITKLAEIDDPSAVGTPADWTEADLYLRQMEAHLVCDPDEVILCSKAYVEHVRETFPLGRRLNLVHNGIDTQVWRPDAGDGRRARFEHGLQDDRPILLFVGRIATMKGIQTVIDAAEAGDFGYQVVVAGEVNANSEEEKEAWRITRRLRSLEANAPWRFRWLGFQKDQSLRDLYAAARLCVMPSVHEPFGLVALETMAMGVPLVCTEVDGLGEIVVDEEGREYAMIIPPRSPQAIVDAAKALRSDAPWGELRTLGLGRVGSFTWDSAAERTIGVYRQAIGRSNQLSLISGSKVS